MAIVSSTRLSTSLLNMTAKLSKDSVVTGSIGTSRVVLFFDFRWSQNPNTALDKQVEKNLDLPFRQYQSMINAATESLPVHHNK